MKKHLDIGDNNYDPTVYIQLENLAAQNEVLEKRLDMLEKELYKNSNTVIVKEGSGGVGLGNIFYILILLWLVFGITGFGWNPIVSFKGVYDKYSPRAVEIFNLKNENNVANIGNSNEN